MQILKNKEKIFSKQLGPGILGFQGIFYFQPLAYGTYDGVEYMQAASGRLS